MNRPPPPSNEPAAEKGPLCASDGDSRIKERLRAGDGGALVNAPLPAGDSGARVSRLDTRYRHKSQNNQTRSVAMDRPHKEREL